MEQKDFHPEETRLSCQSAYVEKSGGEKNTPY